MRNRPSTGIRPLAQIFIDTWRVESLAKEELHGEANRSYEYVEDTRCPLPRRASMYLVFDRFR